MQAFQHFTCPDVDNSSALHRLLNLRQLRPAFGHAEEIKNRAPHLSGPPARRGRCVHPTGLDVGVSFPEKDFAGHASQGATACKSSAGETMAIPRKDFIDSRCRLSLLTT